MSTSDEAARAGKRVSAIVLAGGRSSRFGSDKLAAQLDGRPLLHHAIDAASQIADEVVVVRSATGGPSLPERCRVPMRIARDPTPDGGPLVGLVAGLEAARFPVAVVIGGDMPRLVPTVLAALVDRLGAGPTERQPAAPEPRPRIAAAGLIDDGRIRPLPCALRREPALVQAKAVLAGGRSRLRALLDALDVSGIPEAAWRILDPEASSLFDVDGPDDLARAHRAAGRSP